MTQYAVAYDDHLIQDPGWECVADVLATYHWSGYVTPDHGVTGTLMRRHSIGEPWVAA